MSTSESWLRQVVWTKASKSGYDGKCVEVAQTPEGVAVRDSKDPSGPVLRYTGDEWDAFLDGAKRGEFDHMARRS